MANLEHNPIPQEITERKDPTPFDIATEFCTICDTFSSIKDPQEAETQRQRLIDLASSHAKGTEFIPEGLKFDLNHYGNEPGRRKMDILPEAVKIDLKEKEYGIFSQEGAKRYEKSFLLFKLVNERRRVNGYPVPEQNEEIPLRERWEKAYEAFYREPLQPEPKTRIIFDRTRSRYQLP